MTNELVPACLKFGIYEMGLNGKIVDRRECNACQGDHCPYEVTASQARVCPHCFGTGHTPMSAELQVMDGAESICVVCQGAGMLA